MDDRQRLAGMLDTAHHQPMCAVCRHRIHHVNRYDWECDSKCRCLMLGCVLDRSLQWEI